MLSICRPTWVEPTVVRGSFERDREKREKKEGFFGRFGSIAKSKANTAQARRVMSSRARVLSNLMDGLVSLVPLVAVLSARKIKAVKQTD